ncbi:peptidase domain-containing ABC transporter [Ferruginibacter sp. SUN106]|uniref:peptidase domain-containing ABC transporter n=1 Tax=Ferruginibacter sp. SUN106 TaxID=2978348 RepID=UPI003D366CA9
MFKFPHYKQYDEMDCGPSCLRIICKFYGKTFSLEYFRSLTFTSRSGTSMLSLSKAAEKLKLRTMAAKLSFDDLTETQPFPCIAYWNQKHFLVIYKIKKNKIYVSDPAHGLLTYNKEEFLKSWCIDNDKGIILSLEPTSEFHDEPDEKQTSSEKNFGSIFKYVLKYKREMVQIIAGLVVASLLQVFFPFLTKSVVDIGIYNRDMQFIYMVLLAQLMVFLGKTAIEVLRSYMLLHVSTRVNIHLLSDFFIKLMRLPLGYFDAKMVGDTIQRISDHRRVESFFTSGAINSIFSLLSLLVFGGVLALYSPFIFAVFLAGSLLYILWITLFMKKRAALDYKLFAQMSANQEKNYEMIVGMQEIKLHNAEQKKRWQWELLQIKLFKINIKSLSLKQWQSGGAVVINELKNIIITIVAAGLVVKGSVSLGVMLSVSYIIGQLNSPILQLVEFFQSYQDTTLSLNRINEIHNKPDEENIYDQKITDIQSGDICIENLSFKYDNNPVTPFVLKDINITIPANKVTAIVGSSGSGKTTLLKLLMKFYEPTTGTITIGNQQFGSLSNSKWRDKCGVVMQEGYIFNDSIESNIAVGDDLIDIIKLENAARIANIQDFIKTLPMGYKTKIGNNGMGISTGQKQRILIARAIYKNPDVLFFDEATSALDAKNEKLITENLNAIFKNKTVVIIAHRLSTVKNADNILVLQNGSISESGHHKKLITEKGFYYNLVSNQLELGT